MESENTIYIFVHEDFLRDLPAKFQKILQVKCKIITEKDTLPNHSIVLICWNAGNRLNVTLDGLGLRPIIKKFKENSTISVFLVPINIGAVLEPKGWESIEGLKWYNLLYEAKMGPAAATATFFQLKELNDLKRDIKKTLELSKSTQSSPTEKELKTLVANTDFATATPAIYAEIRILLYKLELGNIKTVIRTCITCEEPATHVCSNCHATAYCGEQCQEADWNIQHAQICDTLIGKRSDGLTKSKAMKIAKHGTVHGRPLTPTQRRYMWYRAGGGK